VQSIFRDAELRDVDFREARMRGGEFGRAVLSGARFGGAQFQIVDFRGANLRGARELTAEQLSQALTDPSTTLPNGSFGPYLKNSGAERAR
jgi:uncharacterized protein YjbI with pentapeptide repeats